MDPDAAPTLIGASALAGALALAASLALAAAALTPASAAAQAPPACPGNLLANPDFEDGFTARGRMAETVANDWTAWYERFPGVDGLNYVPDYAPRNMFDDGPAAVHSGLWSQELATSGATHTAGLWQRVAVPPGTQLLATGAARAWASDHDDPVRSDPPGTYVLSLGIDPRGGTDPNADSIAWSTPITITDTWVPLSVEVAVHQPAVTLFTRGQPLRILAHNVSRWDSLCLRALGPVGEPTSTATSAPLPTRTPGPDEPTPSPTVTEPPAPGTQAALELGLRLDMLGTSTAVAGALPTEPNLSLPERVATRAALDAPVEEATPWPELDDTATMQGLGREVYDRAGLAFLAIAALIGGIVFGVGRARSRDGEPAD
ncbi:MAG: hypothetical protein ACK2T6_01010 [Anaerolineae bacterium]